MLNIAAPQLFSVSKPFVRSSDSGSARDITIEGLGFGQSKGTGNVYLGGTALSTTSWTDTQIVATVPPVGTATGQVPAGPQPLTITADNGKATVNGLTFHVLGGTGGSAYNPTVYEVGPGVATAAYDPTSPASQSAAGANHAVQNAIDDAASSNGSDLVVVYPNAATAGNPRGAYYENLVVSAPVKLQGVGAGGFQGPDNNSPYVPGTILDGGAFGGDTAVATDWFTKVGAMTWAGNQTVSDGSVIYLLASQNAFPTAGSFLPAIDGFDIRGGDQQGFPGNINDLTGQPTGLPPNIVTQGGAIFANAYVRRLQITNNVVENNGGGYGTIRVGTPDIAAPDTNQHNENVRIANNRIVQNAGTNLAGAIGLFAGSDGYEVSGNDICGNFSLEYGAGVSAYGLSPNGSIHHNRIVLNNSNDEGAGIMIAGQLPANPDDLSPGSGPVDIYANQIQGNLANDDGGGIRFLMAGNFPMNVYNNLIANNISTHEGGGIGINEAPDVRIYNNTIMNNITTATAVTSNGTPAPAGVSTSQNSVQLQATLPGGAPTFSEPLLFNNILWDNRAGSRAGTTVTGIGLAGDTTALDHWDVGVADGTGVLAPTSSVIQQNAATEHPYATDASNSSADPRVIEAWDLSVSFATWRQNPAFVDANVVAVEQPPDLMGNYHLQACAGGTVSSACDLGAASHAGVNAPATDIDGDTRPSGAGYDAGSDELTANATEPPAAFLFSTVGNRPPPGVSRPADDADIYQWDSSQFSRQLRMSDYGVPPAADVDGFAQVSATQFYVSFGSDVTIPGLGTVQDEDVIYWDGSAWSVYFDGTAHGMTASAQDVDAIGVRNGVLYFSTAGSKNPPGVSGKGDNADIYNWDGTSYARVFDASSFGVPAKAKVDGVAFVDATHFYMSFAANTTLPGVGPVEDEDIVEFNGGTWTTWFNGTAHGLTASALDIDAFSLPNGSTAP
jgi:hypothetical protein